MFQSSSLMDLHNPQLVRAFKQNQVMVNNLLQKQIYSNRSSSFQMIKSLQPANKPVSSSVQLLCDPNSFVSNVSNKVTNLKSNPRVVNLISQPMTKIPGENGRTMQSLKAINSSLDRELLSRQMSFTKYLMNHQTELAGLLSGQTGEPTQLNQAWKENELLNFVRSYHSKRLHNLRKKMDKKDNSKKSACSYVLVDENVKLSKESKKAKASNNKGCKDKKSRAKFTDRKSIDFDKVTIKVKKLKKTKVGAFVILFDYNQIIV